jgi:acyl-CoA reductase-like NAD-dependent aldehyde dehydrogenase
MTITQKTVDKIIARAKDSDFGLGRGLCHKNGHLQISQYADKDLHALGMLLVNGYDAKYDLISVFIAALEVVAEEAQQETRK